MDVQLLISEAKARFSHNSAKEYLKEKYTSKLLVAEQNGLWVADKNIISFLAFLTEETVILLDTHNNPLKVNRLSLLNKLKTVYETTMLEYYNEYTELENKR